MAVRTWRELGSPAGSERRSRSGRSSPTRRLATHAAVPSRPGSEAKGARGPDDRVRRGVSLRTPPCPRVPGMIGAAQLAPVVFLPIADLRDRAAHRAVLAVLRSLPGPLGVSHDRPGLGRLSRRRSAALLWCAAPLAPGARCPRGLSTYGTLLCLPDPHERS